MSYIDTIPKVITYNEFPEKFFGFTCFAHMIPPFKPEHTLILGYGNGTVAELMRKIWGTWKITGIDLNVDQPEYKEYSFEKMDAYEYVKKCSNGWIKKRFDYICIDLCDDNCNVPSFVYIPEFVIRLKEICKKMVSLNLTHGQENLRRVRHYYDYGFNFERHVAVGDNLVMWWSV